MKHNCLTRALDQWYENRELFRIWYNGVHIICLEREYEPEAMNEYPARIELPLYTPIECTKEFDCLADIFDLYEEEYTTYYYLLEEYLTQK